MNSAEQLNLKQLQKVRAYLTKMVEIGGSDLHLKANSNVRTRINGEIIKFQGAIFTAEDMLTFAKELLQNRFEEFIEKRELDLVYPFDENSRFRVIPVNIPAFDALKLPEIVRSFAEKERGIVLVTGVTGSGKSTTLAAIINEINRTKKKHIITIEDPVEFVHRDNQCIINQRSVGQDTLSFGTALKAALREDPDIILVGEMRDQETINLALHAADTGHLVFSTLHTTDAKETINRIIAQFPTEEQNRVRLSLATVIQGIISQRLVPTIDGKRRAALEILVRTSTIEKLIMENRDFEICDAIEAGKEHYHSQSFDQAIYDLYTNKIISREQALENATSPTDLELKMSGIGAGGAADASSGGSKPMENMDNDIFDLK